MDSRLEEAFSCAIETGSLLLPSLQLRKFPELSDVDAADLVELDISGNRLVQLPPKLEEMQELEQLNCAHNIITKIPDLSNLKSLTVLQRNQLSKLPDEICFLPLQILDVSSNKLTQLPACISRLSETLVDLNLSNNNLELLPDEVCQLFQLRELSVGRNKLDRLPTDLGQLQALVSLDVSNNSITKLPISIAAIVKLTTLNVENNPLIVPPSHICARGRIHILNYLQQTALAEQHKKVDQVTQSENAVSHEQRRSCDLRSQLQEKEKLPVQEENQLERQKLAHLQGAMKLNKREYISKKQHDLEFEKKMAIEKARLEVERDRHFKEQEKQRRLQEEQEKQQRLQEEQEKQQRLQEEQEKQQRLREEHETKRRLQEEQEKQQRLREEQEKQRRLREEQEKQRRLQEEQETKRRLREEQENKRRLREEQEKQRRLREEQEKQQRLREEQEKQRRLREEQEKQRRLREEQENNRRLREEQEKQRRLREEQEKQQRLREEQEKQQRLREEQEKCCYIPLSPESVASKQDEIDVQEKKLSKKLAEHQQHLNQQLELARQRTQTAHAALQSQQQQMTRSEREATRARNHEQRREQLEKEKEKRIALARERLARERETSQVSHVNKNLRKETSLKTTDASRSLASPIHKQSDQNNSQTAKTRLLPSPGHHNPIARTPPTSSEDKAMQYARKVAARRAAETKKEIEAAREEAERKRHHDITKQKEALSRQEGRRRSEMAKEQQTWPRIEPQELRNRQERRLKEWLKKAEEDRRQMEGSREDNDRTLYRVANAADGIHGSLLPISKRGLQDFLKQGGG
eukprot:gene10860-2935_t